jgi:hypothetical protein
MAPVYGVTPITLVPNVRQARIFLQGTERSSLFLLDVTDGEKKFSRISGQGRQKIFQIIFEAAEAKHK